MPSEMQYFDAIEHEAKQHEMTEAIERDDGHRHPTAVETMSVNLLATLETLETDAEKLDEIKRTMYTVIEFYCQAMRRP
jgi:hypothetical protein